MNKRVFLIAITSLFAFSASIANAGSNNSLIKRVRAIGAKNISHPTCEITNYGSSLGVHYVPLRDSNDGFDNVWKNKSKYRNQADLYDGDVTYLDLKVIQQLKKNGFKISDGAFKDNREESPLTFVISMYDLTKSSFGNQYSDSIMASYELMTNAVGLRTGFRGRHISGVTAYSKSFSFAGPLFPKETRVAATYDALFDYILANLPTCTIAK